MAQIRDGLASVTNGSAVVNFTDVVLTGNAQPGNLFSVGTEGIWYEILTVNSATQVTLTSPYGGDTQANVAYVIHQTFTDALKLPYPGYGDKAVGALLQKAFVSLDGALAALGTVNDIVWASAADTITLRKGVTADPTIPSGLIIKRGSLPDAKIVFRDDLVTPYWDFNGASINVGELLVDGSPLTIDPASETLAGKVELATAAESIAGVSNTLAVHPAGLKATLDARINALIAAAPGALDTLDELAAALGDDPNFATTVTNTLATKVTGPASATDNAIARFDATTGKLIQNSAATIDDSGNLTAGPTVQARRGSAGDVTLSLFQTGVMDWQLVNRGTTGLLDITNGTLTPISLAPSTGHVSIGLGVAGAYRLDIRDTTDNVMRISGGGANAMAWLLRADNGGTTQEFQFGVTKTTHSWGKGFYIYSNTDARRDLFIDASGVLVVGSAKITKATQVNFDVERTTPANVTLVQTAPSIDGFRLSVYSKDGTYESIADYYSNGAVRGATNGWHRFFSRADASYGPTMQVDHGGVSISNISGAIASETFSAALVIYATNAFINGITYGAPANVIQTRRNGSATSPTDVVLNDRIGNFNFRGLAGGAENNAAQFFAEVDAAPSGVNVPARFIWSLNNGSSTVERMRLTKDGHLGLGVTPSYRLDVLHTANSQNGTRIKNADNGANAGASIFLEGAIANSSLQFNLWANSGTPYAQIVAASAVSAIYVDANLHIWRSAAQADWARLGSAGLRVGVGATIGAKFDGSAANTSQTSPVFSARGVPNAFEWGHGNSAGYANTFGYQSSSGRPYIVFNGEAGSSVINTIRTRGVKARGLIGDNAGGLSFFTVANANADDQTIIEDVKISSLGYLGIAGATSSSAPFQIASSSARVTPGGGYLVQSYGGGNSYWLLNAATNFNSAIHFGDPDSNTVGRIEYIHNGDRMEFHVGAAERMRIDANVVTFTAAPKLPSYTVGTVPSASTLGAGSQIYVSNESGGAVVAFSDGANWRRVTDRAIIS